ncbi:TAP domain-containing protein [Coniella lustricola]|uniref:mRNA export factor MEX67 n=1 Tax=Coniella lustricola TaxID=2025994 RepID=A0A2T3ACJ7_9PEZI|nr:TAP domain-containing protein [Coniella lustricola]
MAPPTGPRAGSNANSGRNVRSTNGAPRGSSRGGSRGGIAKRGRSSAVRIDRDGDLDMDTSAAGARSGSGASKSTNTSTRRSGRASAPAKSTSRLQQNITRHLGGDISQTPRASRVTGNNTTLAIMGLKASRAASNSDGGIRSLLEFLEKKATHVKTTGSERGRRVRPVAIKKSLAEGDFVYILANEQDADELIKISGFTFAGAVLDIKKSETGWPGADNAQNGDAGLSTAAQDTKMRLQQVLERRYNVETKLLDLSALGQDPVLVEMGLHSSSPETAEKTFQVLMKLCQDLFKTPQQKREAMESVSLGANALASVNPVFSLAETFPDLKHLDLSNNQFSSLKQLNKWRGRFRRLETLLLLNNPIIQTEPNHTSEVMEWFPYLQNLSNVVVRTPQQIAIALEKAKVKDIPQNGNDFRDVNNLGQNFIVEFFPLFDTNRDLLLQTFYDEHSAFTVSVVNGVPKEKDTAVLPWAPYLSFSRNHQRITTEGARLQRHMKGARIQEIWKQLPATQHPSFDTNKYIVDCHPLKGLRDPVNRSIEGELGMIITMHGEFTETQSNGSSGLRSFTRTFVLGPSLTGRGPIRVVSDMLSLHAYNPLPAITGPTQAIVATVAPTPAPAAALSPEEQQQMMLIELTKRTNMTLEYSRMCLEGAEWNFDRALAIFEEKRAALPAEAFIQA